MQKHKPTGFTKLQLAAKVKDIPESTHNLKLIFDEIRINQVSRKFKMIGDLKIYNMLLGMQSSGSIHPYRSTRDICPIIGTIFVPL